MVSALSVPLEPVEMHPSLYPSQQRNPTPSAALTDILPDQEHSGTASSDPSGTPFALLRSHSLPRTSRCQARDTPREEP